ncbi:MAG TPA: DUF1559 domain-containing protein [Gemmataceae bacterium]|jgi:hypothetical protein|nr:DUF1559 domain-containing protein [Gemmataceae bacterium]
MMSKITACTLLLILAAPSLADDKKFDADARAKAVAPFLDDQTILIAHGDLTRLDVDAIAAKLTEYARPFEEHLAEAKRELGDWFGAWTKAGVRDMYVVVSLADVPGQPPFLVIPLEGDGDGKGISEAMSQSKHFEHFKFEKIGSAVVGGGPRTMARVKNLKADNRPELAKAFAAAGDTAVQAILIPTNENRKIVEEIMPRLPKELGGGPITTVTRGFLWAAVGVDLAPKASVHVTVQSQDAGSAKKLRDLLAQFFKSVGEEGPHNQKARDVLPGFDKLVERLTPKIQEDRLVVTLDEKDLAATLKPVVVKAQDRAEQTRSMNNLKQIGLAMHNFHDANRHFPMVANFDKAEKPLLSWRVHLLPFLDQVQLYKQFHLDEPWDSEHNKKLIEKMPAPYRSTKNKELLQAGKTTYLAPVGEHLMFTGTPKTISFRDITDGTSNTIMLVDGDDDHAVIWTKPDDLKVDPKNPKAGLRNNPGSGFLILLGDGSVHYFPANIDVKTLNALFTRDGGEVIKYP